MIPPRWMPRLFPNTPVKPKHKLLFNSFPYHFPTRSLMPSLEAISCRYCLFLFLSVLLCRWLGRAQTSRRLLGRINARRLRIVAILMRFAPSGRLAPWLHHRQVRPGFLGPLCKVDCYALLHVLTFRIVLLGAIARLAGFRNPALPLVPSRRNSSGLGH